MRLHWIVSLSTLALAACEPPKPEVHIDFVSASPAEVDTIQDNCSTGKEISYETFALEETCVQVTVPIDDYFIEARQVSLDFTDYCVTYEYVYEDGTLENYCNGFGLHADAGETWSVPVRVVSSAQKETLVDTFGGDLVTVRTTLTLYATNTWNGADDEYSASYDAIMGNFNTCDRDPVVDCAVVE